MGIKRMLQYQDQMERFIRNSKNNPYEHAIAKVYENIKKR